MAGPIASFKSIVAITPSDSVDLPGGYCQALMVGVAGAAKVTDANGNTVTIPLLAGITFVAVRRVWATGTTAINMFSLH